MKTSKTSLSAKSQPGKKGLNWGTAIFLVTAHIAGIAALFFFSWPGVITALVLYWVGGSLGIGMGFHRLITHRGYRVPKPIEYFLVVCGALALEGGPIQWVTTHRIHHAHTDRDGDPHTPRDGGWWSHVGWILRGTPQDHDQATLFDFGIGKGAANAEAATEIVDGQSADRAAVIATVECRHLSSP